MKIRVTVGMSVIVVALAMGNLFVGHAQQVTEPVRPVGNGAPPLSNPLKVALLKLVSGQSSSN
jgi:hypothetical protein